MEFKFERECVFHKTKFDIRSVSDRVSCQHDRSARARGDVGQGQEVEQGQLDDGAAAGVAHLGLRQPGMGLKLLSVLCQYRVGHLLG